MKRTVFHIDITCGMIDATEIMQTLAESSGYEPKSISLWTSEEEVEPSTNTNNGTKAEIRDICLDN